jgi:hypothetical protein
LFNIDRTHTQTDKENLMIGPEENYPAIVYVLESSNSVVIHFGGFKDNEEAQKFSHRIIHDLGIAPSYVPPGVTLH